MPKKIDPLDSRGRYCNSRSRQKGTSSQIGEINIAPTRIQVRHKGLSIALTIGKKNGLLEPCQCLGDKRILLTNYTYKASVDI